MKFYIIGAIIAFVLGGILAYAEHRKSPNKEQQLEILAVIAVASWASVVLLLWKYKDVYLELLNELFKENR